MGRPRGTTRAGRAAGVVCAALSAACGASVPEPVVVGAVGEAPSIVEVPLGARWIVSRGATLVGPRVGGSVLVLVGGRRALVDAAGSAKAEAKPSPEPLEEVALVPTPEGDVLVARSEHTLFRLPDPLGAPVAFARFRTKLRRLGAAPNAAVVWTEGAAPPMFVDPNTGAARPLDRAPLAPPIGMMFVDGKRGAALFPASGLATTTDAGATWRLASGKQAADPLHVTGLRVGADGSLRAFVFGDGPDASIDLDHAEMSALAPQSPNVDAPPLIAWVRTTGRDPLEVAAAGGIDTAGGALVASHGLLARVDLETGLVRDAVGFARGRFLNPCAAARGSDASVAFVACALSEGENALFDPFGLLRVRLAGKQLEVDKPLVIRNGEAELRSSPSGGVLLLAPCSERDENGIACVKQRDGTWATVRDPNHDSELDLPGRGAGPLVEGAVAFVRGLTGPEPIDDAAGRHEGLRIAALDKEGRERALGAVIFDVKPAQLRVESPIEEDEGHALHLVLVGDRTPYSVIVQPGETATTPHPIPDARFARIHAGRGFALGESAALASLDGGASWSRAEASAEIFEALARVEGSLDDPNVFAVSEVGVRIGSVLRVGWGAPAAVVESAAVTVPFWDEAPPPDLGPERVLRCASRGPSTATPPPSGQFQIAEVLSDSAARSPANDKKRGESSAFAATSRGVFDTSALLQFEGPKSGGRDAKADASRPRFWTLRWLDPLEQGGRVHRTTLREPDLGDAVVSGLKAAHAEGDRAIFGVRLSSKYLLVRVRPGASPELREVPPELVPSAHDDLVFGNGASGEAVAWIRDTSIVLWTAGSAPRVVATVATPGRAHLGAPTQDGLPLVVDTADAELVRTLRLGSADAAGAIPLDGWTKLPRSMSSPTRLGPCSKGSKGAHVWLPIQRGRAIVDGVDEPASMAVFELIAAVEGACVAAVAERLVPPREVDGAGKRASGGPAAFVRAELMSGRAEGGDLGAGAALHERRMVCTLE